MSLGFFFALVYKNNREVKVDNYFYRELWKKGVSIALGTDKLLIEPAAAPTVAEFMVKTGLLG